MSSISTHVLDTNRGRPAAAIPVRLSQNLREEWKLIAEDLTDADGRIRQLLPKTTVLASATYRLSFDTGAYFTAQNLESLFPVVEITFTVSDPAMHHHIPLLLAANGYSTYRGS